MCKADVKVSDLRLLGPTSMRGGEGGTGVSGAVSQ